MRRTVVVAVVGVVGVVLAAAGAAAFAALNRSEASENANGSVAVRHLSSITGEYVSVNDAGAPTPVLDAVPVRLVVAKDRIIAHAGCNSIQARARVEDGRLVLHELETTLIGCPPDVAAQERWVVTMLQARPRLERSGPYLSLLWDGHWLGLSSDASDRAGRADRSAAVSREASSARSAARARAGAPLGRSPGPRTSASLRRPRR